VNLRDCSAQALSKWAMATSSTANEAAAVGREAWARGPESIAADFAAIYEAHSRAVYYLALRLLGDATRAEDAAHDVFLKAFRNLAGFRRDSVIRTWLYRITINHCQNLRQAWHERNIATTEDGEVEAGADAPRETPLRIAEAKELGAQIQRSLEAIPNEYRLLLLLVADEEMTYEQIAELTRQSCDCVRGKLYRARKAFAAAFKQTA
jgi:RNA polymerase sigma-70 factor (ECF subfamily)